MTTDKNEAGNLLPQAFTFNASNQQVRHEERREAFMSDFRKLLREAQPVRLTVEKGGSNGTL